MAKKPAPPKPLLYHKIFTDNDSNNLEKTQPNQILIIKKIPINNINNESHRDKIKPK